MLELLSRGGAHNRSVHVINVEIRDNHEDATIGGRLILQLAQAIEASPNWDDDMETILADFMKRNPTVPILHNVSYY